MNIKKLLSISGIILATKFAKVVAGDCGYSEGWSSDCTDNTFFLFNGNDHTAGGFSLITNSNDGYLYYCETKNTSKTCKLVQDIKNGFIVNNKDSAFSCNGSTKQCKIFTVVEECNASNIGKIYYTVNGAVTTISLCRDYDGSGPTITSTNLSSSSAGDYIVKGIDSNVFGITTGALGFVSVAANSVFENNSGLPECIYSSGKCTYNGNNLKNNAYCMVKGEIYKGTDNSGSCSVTYGHENYDEGIQIFDRQDLEEIKKILPSTETGTSSIASSDLILYDCAYGKCIQTYGYVRNLENTYEISETGTSTFSNEECSAANVGKVKYTSAVVGTSPEKFEICGLKEITIPADGTPTASYEALEISSTINNHFVIKPSPTPASGTFAGFNYYNIGLVKTQPYTAALSMKSPQLPECTSYSDSDVCKVGTIELSEGEGCIKGGFIYKTINNKCTKSYGITNGTGIKIFQKGSNFNTYKDVTNSLYKIIPNAPERTPLFVIYDCSDASCSQTSGFIKYKLSTAEPDDPYEFMNCYSQADTDLYSNKEYSTGCVKLNVDGSTGANVDCSIAKASSGTFKYTDFGNGIQATFESCFSPKIASSDTNPRYITMNINKNRSSLFLFTNGVTPFPDTVLGQKALIKINSYSAVLAKASTAGYYINSGSIYPEEALKPLDALIYCKSNKVEECEVRSARAGYYLNSGEEKSEKPVIRCDGTTCKAEAVTKKVCGNDENKQVVGGVIFDENKLKICVSGGNSIEIKSGATVSYENLELLKEEDFPGAQKSTISVKVNSDASVTLLVDVTLPTCTENAGNNVCFDGAVNNQYCIKSGKIYLTTIAANGSATCALMTNQQAGLAADAGGPAIIYFNNDYEKIGIPTETTTNIMAYQCLFNPSSTYDLLSCDLIKGYISDMTAGENKKIIHCNGWKGEGCTVTTKTTSENCSNDDEGKIVGKGTKICFGTTTTHSIPTTSPASSQYIAYKSSTINKNYGINKNDVALLSFTYISSTYSSVILTKVLENAQKGYHLNSKISGTKNEALIYCGDTDVNNCIVKDAFNGYYLNSGEDKDTKELIECTTTGCSTITVPTTANCEDQEIGTLITGKKICTTPYENDDGTPIDIKVDVSYPIYKSLEIKANKFPSVTSDSTVTVRFGEDCTAIIVENVSLPTCDSVSLATTNTRGCTSGNERINSCISNKKIYITEGVSCKMLSGASESEFAFFDKNISYIKNPTLVDDTAIYFGYKCSFTTEDNGITYSQNTCELIKGYVIISDSLIQCSGWKYEMCIKEDISGSDGECSVSEDEDDGTYQIFDKLCFGTKKELPETSKQEIIVAEFIVPSSTYGVGSGIVFFTVNDKQALVTSVPNTTGTFYYINQNFKASDSRKTLIKCTNGSCTSMNGIYHDETEGIIDSAYINGADITTKSIIKCTATDTACTLEIGSTENGQVYIDASQESSKKSKNLIVCTNDGCTSITKTSGTYISAITNSNIITCDSTQCKSEANGSTSGTNKYFVDGLDSSNTIICTYSPSNCISSKYITLCSGNAGSTTELCKYKNTANTDVFLPSGNYCMNTDGKLYKSNANKCTIVSTTVLIEMDTSTRLYKEGNIGVTNSGIIFKCDGSTSCTQYTSVITLLENKYHIKYLYQCDISSNCLLINQPNIGSYLSGLPTSGYHSKLIKCSTNEASSCLEVPISVSSDTYFVDSGTPGNVIKCIQTNGCQSIKGNTDPGVAYIDGNEDNNHKHPNIIICKDGTCTSEDKCTHLTEGSKVYFIQNNKNGHLIVCDNENKCVDTSSTDGLYIDGTDINSTIECTNSAANCNSTPECRVTTGVNCKDKTYYLVKDKNDYIIGLTGVDVNSVETNVGYLFYCEKNSQTGKIECSSRDDIGYYVNSSEGEIISCVKCDDNTIRCTEATAAANGCGSSNTGLIFLNSNKDMSLCLSGDDTNPISVILSSKNQNYLLQYHATNNIFGLSSTGPEYALIKVGENFVVMDREYNFEKNYYVYINPSSYNVLEMDQCPVGLDDPLFSSSIREYECLPTVCKAVA